ncbi:hypothetical protein RJ639_030707 [Escallonia herrerae]|uniref:Seipin n=1 Tax=Escallonia herrerae TaxID=1293975 RepID=A0AA88X0S4_9ASTE|nr:hypothetical protein RJ639_030707 [Escallonia herrerae]
MQTHLKTRLRRFRSPSTTVPPQSASMNLEEEEVEEEKKLPIPNPAMWFAKLISLQADIIYDCLVCLLSPFISLMSIASESAEEAKESVNTAVHAATTVPSKVVYGGTLLLKKLGFGFLAAAYVGLVLVFVMFLAVLLGVVSVQLWLEEPVFLRETLHFDYADEHPKAVFDFLGGGGGGGFEGFRYGKRKRVMGVPVGHTFYVTLVLLMPESDFNREIGMFQCLVLVPGFVIVALLLDCLAEYKLEGLSLVQIIVAISTGKDKNMQINKIVLESVAKDVGHLEAKDFLWLVRHTLPPNGLKLTSELVSTNGNVIARSSHPCILHFRSLPVRLMQTFLMAIPLLLGITTETQRISILLIKHKERSPRTEAIRISMIPRAKTNFLPQVYEAEIHLKSELPWRKELVHSWKWTFYVWTSLSIYIMLLVLLVCCFRPLIFPVVTRGFSSRRPVHMAREVSKEAKERGRDDKELSETLSRWQQSRRKRRVKLLHGNGSETVGSSASSITVTREDSCATAEDSGNSESVCYQR